MPKNMTSIRRLFVLFISLSIVGSNASSAGLGMYSPSHSNLESCHLFTQEAVAQPLLDQLQSLDSRKAAEVRFETAQKKHAAAALATFSIFSDALRAKLRKDWKRFSEKEIARLEKVSKVQFSTLSDAVRALRRLRYPEGTLVFINADLAPDDFEAVARANPNFEIIFLRIRGTKRWIAVKGTDSGVPVEPAHSYLYDVAIHNHVRAPRPFPSPRDFAVDLFRNYGHSVMNFVVGLEGLTHYSIDH